MKLCIQIITVLLTLGIFSLAVAADCAEDIYIPLAYPNEYDVSGQGKYDGDARPDTIPKNAGFVWIPKEACGKNVDLLIAYHGWRTFDNPEDSIYLNPPPNSLYLGYPGQQSQQKDFDKTIRGYINTGKSAPMIVAAPMHDRGPERTVFTSDVYNINHHITLVKQEMAQRNLNIEFSRVSLIGHSNANCGGGLERAAKELQAYPLYFYGAADGTCGQKADTECIESADYIKNVIPFIQAKSNSFLFHMHQGRYCGDLSSATSIKSSGGDADAQAILSSEYTETWRSSDGNLYTYLVNNLGHSHTTIPTDMLKEILPRFFPSTELPSVVAGQAAVKGASSYEKVPKTVEGCSSQQRCKEIDQAWSEKVSVFIGGLGAYNIWDHLARSWKKFDEMYYTYKLSQIISQSTTVSQPITQISAQPLPQFAGIGPCFNMALSSTEQEAATKLVSMQFQGRTISVNKIIAPVIKKIDAEITQANTGYDFYSVRTFQWRCVKSPVVNIVDQTTCHDDQGEVEISKHSYGIALDINSKDNPYCVIGSDGTMYRDGKKCPVHPNGKYYNIPEQIIQIFKANDFRWGGDWKKAKDYMHFDWQGNLGDFNGDGTVKLCPKGTTTSSFSTPLPGSSTLNKEIIKSKGNSNRDVTILTGSTFDPSKSVSLYFYFGGSNSYINNIISSLNDHLVTLAQQKNLVFVIPQAPNQNEGKWMNGDSGSYQELFNDVQSYISATTFSEIVFIAHSYGGAAIKNIVGLNLLSPIKPTKLVFFDACSGNWCQVAKDTGIPMIVVQNKNGFATYGLTEEQLNKQIAEDNVQIHIVTEPHDHVPKNNFEYAYS